MTQKVLFRNQVSQRSGAQSKLATLASQAGWLTTSPAFQRLSSIPADDSF